MADNWIVVSDFDGTFTQKDVGNELCKLFVPEKYRDLQAQYRAGTLNLKDYQKKVWENFPCSKEKFAECAQRVGSFRPGVNEFLEHCLHLKIPVYIASCGIDVYIDSVLSAFTSAFAVEAIHGKVCNSSQFGTDLLECIIPPESDPDSPYPLHKGKWAQKKSEEHEGAKILAIGNGTSDRSFVGHVDSLWATDAFADYCEEQSASYQKFETFFDLYKGAFK